MAQNAVLQPKRGARGAQGLGRPAEGLQSTQKSMRVHAREEITLHVRACNRDQHQTAVVSAGGTTECSTRAGTGLPEGEGVVAHEGLALPHKEGAVRGPGLDAVLGEQALGDVPSIPPRPELPVEPLLTGVQLRAATGLRGEGNGKDTR